MNYFMTKGNVMKLSDPVTLLIAVVTSLVGSAVCALILSQMFDVSYGFFLLLAAAIFFAAAGR